MHQLNQFRPESESLSIKNNLPKVLKANKHSLAEKQYWIIVEMFCMC